MYFTTLWSKEKEIDFFFKLEKLIRCYLQQEKYGYHNLEGEKLVHNYF